ncbi:MAG TPA: hypothetical protein VMH28_31740 [Candidatus Acidoferrales bacterium]|nr:hypothetical protein [Candidatus Acidoferrales bacterium]
MRFRSFALALALALGAGSVATVHAADKTVKRNMKRNKQINKQRLKQSKAGQVKPRKAKKIKHA